MLKQLRLLFISVLIFALIVTLVTYPPYESQANNVEVQRIPGEDRYKTAVEISKFSWQRSDTVVLARGDEFADALTGSPLAYVYNAPILLTRPHQLHQATRKEIERLRAKEVILLGGTNAISSSVESELWDMGLSVRRLGGDNRYQTALRIANELRSKQGVNTKEVIIVSGESFPDAMSVAPYAARRHIPILLTRHNHLPEETRQYVRQVNRTIIVGGPAVISENVRRMLPQPQRIAGNNRYETSVRVIEELNMPVSHVMVTSGVTFADALTGSILAARQNMPVLLSEPHRLRPATQQFVNRYDPGFFLIIGGEAAISNTVVMTLQGIQNSIKIFIDPGHGGSDPGAVANGLREKDLALEISLRVRDILLNEYSHVEVRMSRTTDVFINLSQRAAMANNWGADYFVSIHHNAGGGTGFESYIFNNTSNSKTYEKRAILHDHIVQSLSKYNVRDRGKQAANFAVLRETKMSAVLLELLFIDNVNDARLLGDPRFREDVSRAVAEGIAKAWNLPKK